MAQKIPCYNLIRKGEQRENNIKNQGKVEMVSVSEDAQISVPGTDLWVKFVHLSVLKTLKSQVKARGSCIQNLFLCNAPGPRLPLSPTDTKLLLLQVCSVEQSVVGNLKKPERRKFCSTNWDRSLGGLP